MNAEPTLVRDTGPAGVVQRPRARGGPSDEATEGGDDRLSCAACGRLVTPASERVAVDGASEHAFQNPAGVAFVIGCFARAVGCVGVGERSPEWTWFPGTAWRIELCVGCRAHLGWSYTYGAAALPAFYGLILDRLVRARDAAG